MAPPDETETEVPLHKIADAVNHIVACNRIIEERKVVEHAFELGIIEQAAHFIYRRALQAIKILHIAIEQVIIYTY